MKDSFIVFEPMNHMMKVIIAAKKRGLKIIVFHSMPLSFPFPFEEAESCIDLAIKINSWSNLDNIMHNLDSLALDCKFVGTYAAAEITLYAESLVRERFKLLTTPSNLILKYLNKYEVRKKLCSSGISKLKYIHSSEIDTWSFDTSVFFKPCCGAGSTRVKKCDTYSDVLQLIEQWDDKTDIFPPILRDFIEQNNDYFLEEAIEGELLSVECLTHSENPFVLGISSRSLLKKNKAIELGASFPYQHHLSAEIIDKVIKAHHALGITHGPTHTEVIVSNTGVIEIIEVNLRMAGSDMLLLINSGLKIQLEEYLVDLSLGKKPEGVPQITDHISAMQLILAPDGTKIFESIQFPPDVEFKRQLKPSGTKLNSTDTEGDYVGSFLISAENNQSLFNKIKTIRNNTYVNGKLICDTENNEFIFH